MVIIANEKSATGLGMWRAKKKYHDVRDGGGDSLEDMILYIIIPPSYDFTVGAQCAVIVIVAFRSASNYDLLRLKKSPSRSPRARIAIPPEERTAVRVITLYTHCTRSHALETFPIYSSLLLLLFFSLHGDRRLPATVQRPITVPLRRVGRRQRGDDDARRARFIPPGSTTSEYFQEATHAAAGGHHFTASSAPTSRPTALPHAAAECVLKSVCVRVCARNRVWCYVVRLEVSSRRRSDLY